MEHSKSIKREWIKNIAIVFLIIMLILTFFSNTIMNHSLPTVTAQYMESGIITYKVRGNAVVESTDPYQIKVKYQRVIDSIEVKEGDHVEKGQTICYLSSDDCAELKAAKTDLEKAKIRLSAAENKYMMKLVTSGLDTATISKDGKLKNKQDYIETINAANTVIDVATIELEAQEDIMATLKKKRDDIKRKIDSTPANTADVTEEVKALNNAKTAYDNAIVNVSQKSNAIDEISREIQNVIDNTPNGNEPDIDELKKKKSQAEKEKNDALSDKNKAEYAMNMAQNVLDNKKASGDTSALLKELNNQLTLVNCEIANGEEVLEKKKENYEKSKKELEKITSDITTAFNIEDLKFDVDNARIEVDSLQDKIYELSKSAEINSIDAPIEGTIVNLMIHSGDEIPVDGVVAIMQPKGKGYKMEMLVEKEKTKYLSVGDKADAINSWKYSELNISISSIMSDKAQPDKYSVVCFDVAGENIGVGENIGISVGQKSDSYDMIVPNSAIHEDNQGTFIYKVTTKQTPLGTRYYAQRVNVDILASDDMRSAIFGYINVGEFIVTGSNKPLTDNQQIKLTE